MCEEQPDPQRQLFKAEQHVALNRLPRAVETAGRIGGLRQRTSNGETRHAVPCLKAKAGPQLLGPLVCVGGSLKSREQNLFQRNCAHGARSAKYSLSMAVVRPTPLPISAC